MSTVIYYDGDCPFCAKYTDLVRLKEAVGRVSLVDLRADADTRRRLTAEGFDLDAGMVVEHDGTRRGGADAASWIAAMSSRDNMFNTLNHHTLSSPFGARVIYPVLRAGRWLALIAMGRNSIAERDEGVTARRTLFAMLFAFFSMFHVLTYALKYQAGTLPDLDLIMIFLAGLLVLARPGSMRLLTLLMLVSTISAVAQAPVASNHTMVRNVVLLGWWIAFGWAMMRGRTSDDMFRAFAPAGCAALIVMYIYGCFHKINSDFLDPVTSCATALWARMPAPLAAIDATWMSYLGIYGTFLAEGAILLALLIKRTRHLAVVAGIGFHMLLALSGYAMYISFTMLSIALHMLWLNGEASQQVLESRAMQAVQSRMRNPVYIGAAALYLGGAVLAAMSRDYALVTIFLIPIVAPFLWVVVRHGRSTKSLFGTTDKPGIVIGTIVGALFFVNCALPYFGLKTAQTLNMFANLRLEAGVSNHLIVRDVGPFDYLEDVAVIHDADPRLELAYHSRPGMGVVYYDLLARLENNPGARVSFTLNGVRRDGVTSVDLRDDIDARLHPRWMRKWFHFQPVMLTEPETCNA